MPRSRNKVASRRRRRKILDQAKGYWGKRSNVYKFAKNAVEKGMLYQYRDRKVRKREFRKLWITRINAAARQNDTTYSRLMGALNKKNIEINRKVLADLAVNDPDAFSAIVEEAAN
ncbi:50S ribosomal protein L20 [Fodinibius sp.]|uniref:50S ribosomal protein L20 n=1 Tax=Fodinibius sp. TaxID=1872440 RepID=UPI003566A204